MGKRHQREQNDKNQRAADELVIGGKIAEKVNKGTLERLAGDGLLDLGLLRLDGRKLVSEERVERRVVAVADVEDLFDLRVAAAGLPARHRLPRDVQLLGKGLLRHAALLSDLLQLFAKGHFPVPPFLSVWLSYRPRRVFSTNLRLRFAFFACLARNFNVTLPAGGAFGAFP